MVAAFAWRNALYGLAEPIQALCEKKLASKTFLHMVGALAILRSARAQATLSVTALLELLAEHERAAAGLPTSASILSSPAPTRGRSCRDSHEPRWIQQLIAKRESKNWLLGT